MFLSVNGITYYVYPSRYATPPRAGAAYSGNRHRRCLLVDPSVHIITLAVDDLDRALAFYRDGLGLPTKGVIADEYEGSETEAAGAIVRFDLDGGLILSLYPRRDLAKDARIAPTPPASGEFSIGHIVRQRSEVDALLAQAREAGATVTDEAHERPWGIYSGYFRDPDGHLWEIISSARSPRDVSRST
jgi:uncharacterized protein